MDLLVRCGQLGNVQPTDFHGLVLRLRLQDRRRTHGEGNRVVMQ